MEIEYIMALITLGAVVVSFISVQTTKAQTIDTGIVKEVDGL